MGAIMRINRNAMVVLALGLMALTSRPAAADQGGVGFWLPGAFGSMAATPLVPGWALGAIYLHSSVSAGGDVAASRAIAFPNRSVNLNVNLDANLRATADLGILSPSYVFATPVLGGQFAVNVLAIYGRQQATIDANIAGSLGPIGFATQRSVEPSDRRHSVTYSCSRHCAGTRASTITWSMP